MARLLNFLRECPESGFVAVSDIDCEGIRWWKIFLPGYNGVLVILESQWSTPYKIFASNACLTGSGWVGMGGGGGGVGVVPASLLSYHVPKIYSWSGYVDMHINGLEMLTIAVA